MGDRGVKLGKVTYLRWTLHAGTAHLFHLIAPSRSPADYTTQLDANCWPFMRSVRSSIFASSSWSNGMIDVVDVMLSAPALWELLTEKHACNLPATAWKIIFSSSANSMGVKDQLLGKNMQWVLSYISCNERLKPHEVRQIVQQKAEMTYLRIKFSSPIFRLHGIFC